MPQSGDDALAVWYEYAVRLRPGLAIVALTLHSWAASALVVPRAFSPIASTTQFEPDAAGLGRIARIGSPGNAATEVEWEPGGERLARLSGNGREERFCYDGPGRLVRLAVAVAFAAGTDPCTAQTFAGLEQYDYAYDLRGNRTSETRTDAQGSETTRYGYDLQDRLTGVRYPDGTAELYELSATGSRTGQKTLSGYLETGPLGPEAFGAPGLEVTYPGAVHLRFVVSTDERLTSLEVKDGSAWVPYGHVSSDEAGRVTRLDLDGRDRTFQWDADNRLRRVTEGSQVTTYDYSPDGMRISLEAPGESVKYLWGAGELLEETSTLADATFRYERRGELVTGLQASTGSGQPSVPFVVDGLGSILGRVEAGALVAPQRFGAWGASRGLAPALGQPSIGLSMHQWTRLGAPSTRSNPRDLPSGQGQSPQDLPVLRRRRLIA